MQRTVTGPALLVDTLPQRCRAATRPRDMLPGGGVSFA
jgi:hypothetical protein